MPRIPGGEGTRQRTLCTYRGVAQRVIYFERLNSIKHSTSRDYLYDDRQAQRLPHQRLPAGLSGDLPADQGDRVRPTCYKGLVITDRCRFRLLCDLSCDRNPIKTNARYCHAETPSDQHHP